MFVLLLLSILIKVIDSILPTQSTKRRNKTMKAITLLNSTQRIKMVTATSTSILILFAQIQPSLSAGSCKQPRYIATQNWDCSCIPTGPVFGPVSCGSGKDTDSYYTCSGGYETGYLRCIDPTQKIGTEWNCKVTTSWNATIACSGLAAAAVAACLSTAAHAGTLCLASVGAYISQCSGCAPVTCRKTNERDVNGQVISYQSDTCPDSSNTGN